MKQFTIFCLAAVSLCVWSCDSESTQNGDVTAPTEDVAMYNPETLEAKIIELEGLAMNPDHPKSREIMGTVIEFCVSFQELYPRNAKAPEMLFKAGNHCVNLEDYKSALNYYAKVENHYRDYQKRPECIFLQGFVYETYLNELGKAKEKYAKIIQQYPKHVLAEQSQQSIDYLGMTDEERFQQFQAN